MADAPLEWDGDPETLPPLEQIEHWSHEDCERIFMDKFEAFWAGVTARARSRNDRIDAGLLQLLTRHTWGDTRAAIRVIDGAVVRLYEVLRPEMERLEGADDWPSWLDGRDSDEFTVDAEALGADDRLLLVAALAHDLKLSWDGDRDSASWILRRLLAHDWSVVS